jgi:glycopeptide antibiotics resistance protein
LTVFEISLSPFVIHKAAPTNAIIDIRIHVAFEPLNLFVEIRNTAMPVVIIDPKHKTIKNNITICFIPLLNLFSFLLYRLMKYNKIIQLSAVHFLSILFYQSFLRMRDSSGNPFMKLNKRLQRIARPKLLRRAAQKQKTHPN